MEALFGFAILFGLAWLALSFLLPIILWSKLNKQEQRIKQLEEHLQQLTSAGYTNATQRSSNQQPAPQTTTPDSASQEKEISPSAARTSPQHTPQDIPQAPQAAKTAIAPTATTKSTPVPAAPTPQEPTSVSTPAPAPISPLPTPIPPPTTQQQQQQTPRIEPDERSPSVVTSLVQSVVQWFTGGNLIVRVGVLVLLVGVVFLLRLASDYFTAPIELRLGLVALGGLIATALGLKLSKKRRGYGLTLQGAGLATIYLTLFAAFKMYHVLPSTLTFGLLAILAVISAVFAVKQDALPLAVLAFGGAFFAPILTATDSGNVVGLFSYYLVLNCGLAIIAHFRTWKILNALGAFVTFGLAYFWGANAFDTELLDNARWKLVILTALHLALYLFITLRYSQQLIRLNATKPEAATEQKGKRIQTVDVGLLFGVPLLGFGLLAGLLNDIPYALAVASAILSAIYLALGWHLVQRSTDYRLITQGAMALGVGFLALVIPLALSAKWTAVGWAVQGAALVWLGVQGRKSWSVLFGLLLQTISVGIGMYLMASAFRHHHIAIGLVAITCLVSAFMLRLQTTHNPNTPNNERKKRPSLPFWQNAFFSHSSLIAASLFTLLASCSILYNTLPFWFYDISGLGVLVSLLGLLALLYGIDKTKNWTEARNIARFALPALALGLVLGWYAFIDINTNTLSSLTLPTAPITGMLLWVLTVTGLGVMGCIWLRHWHAHHIHTRADQMVWLGTIFTLGALIAWYYTDLGFDYGSAQDLAPALATIALGSGLLWLHQSTQTHKKTQSNKPLHNPTNNTANTAQAWLHIPQTLSDINIIAFPVLALWFASINIHSNGAFWGLPYLPVVNALDITLIAALLYVALLVKQRINPYSANVLYAGTTLAAFWMLSSMLVRTLHGWVGTPLWTHGAWFSSEVQTGFTILWSIIALVLTVYGSKKDNRMVWYAGIALLTLVVLKLVAIDLSKSSAILRVVSFMGAGMLMLVIGYLAPLPPKKKTAAQKKPSPTRTNTPLDQTEQTTDHTQ